MLTPLNHYQNTQVTTSSPEKILLMLYDGAINFARLALEKLEKNDLAGKGKYIGKAQAIVAELMNTLNHDVGGEISQRLEQLYIYLINEFSRANTTNSAKSLNSAIEVLVILRDAWGEAVTLLKKERDEMPQQHNSSLLAAG